jgi:hypothetical protein
VKTLIATLMLVPTLALAQTQQQYQPMEVSRSAMMQGKNELSAQIGFQASMGGTTPGGVKLFFDYSRYLGKIVWLNAKLNPTFSAGGGGGVCVDQFGNTYNCGLSGFPNAGHAIDALIGVKLKWPIARYKLMPFAVANVGVVGIYNRPLNDDGAAGVVNLGGGLRWFATPHVAVGGELGVTLGGAYYTETCGYCNNAHSEFYRAFNFGLGAEFIL